MAVVDISADMLRLRNFIQEWLDSHNQTWSGLFTKAGHNNGSSTIWSKGRLKSYPKVQTMYDIADAMGVSRYQLMAVAGMIPEVGPDTLHSEKGVNLSPRELSIVESFRILAEDHKSIVFNQITAMAESMRSASGGN